MRLTLLCSLVLATFFLSLSTNACVGRSFPETLGFPLLSITQTCTSGTADVCASEVSGAMQVEVTLSRSFQDTVTVNYTVADIGSAEIGVDFEATSGTLTYPPGTTSRTVTVVLIDDDEDEDDEDTATDDEEKFEFRISTPTGGALISGSTATCEINDNDVTSIFSVTGATVDEGDLGEVTELTFVVSLDPPLTQDATVVYTTAEDTTGLNPATEGSDYRGSFGTLTFLAGETSKNVTILINGDDAPEIVGSVETFQFQLSSPLPASFTDLDPVANLAIGSITDDDGNQTVGTTLYVDAPTALENGDLTFTVHALPAAIDTIDISYATGTPPASGGATPNIDYTVTPLGNFQIAIGETSGTFVIDVLDDADAEVNETIVVDLTRISGTADFIQTGNPALASASGLILNDDVPFVGIGDAGIMEGDVAALTSNTIRVPVNLVTADGEATTFGSPTLEATVFVDYATSVPTTSHDDPATEDVDYTPVSGTLVFNPGEQTQYIDIPVIADRIWEPNEAIDVSLSANTDNPSDVELATVLNGANADFTTSLARIVDDEPGHDFNGDGALDIVVGAPKVDDGGSDRGKIYIFLGPFSAGSASPDLSAATDADITITGEFDDDELSRIAIGDFNGDGLDDIACGAPGEELGGTKGRVFVYFGNPGAAVIGEASPSSTHVAGDGAATWDVSITGDTADGDVFGQQVACLGDVNGDGYEDLAASDNLYSLPSLATVSFTGKAYIFHGGTGLAGALDVTNAQISIDGVDNTGDTAMNGELFGENLSRAGDIDGDGLGDLIVGARRAEAAGAATVNGGRAYVFLSSGALSSATDAEDADVIVEGEAGLNNEYLGARVSDVGDINADGFDEVCVTTYWKTYSSGNAWNFAGRAYIFFGSDTLSASVASPLDAGNADVSFESDSAAGAQDNDGMGYAIRGIGDFNGDDVDDLAVTAVGWWRSTAPANGTDDAVNPSGRGRCYVFTGGATAFTSGLAYGDLTTATNPTMNSAAFLIVNGGNDTTTDNTNREEMGRALGAIGDLDGDGMTDLMIASAYSADDAEATEGQGRVYVLSGIDDATQSALSQKDINSNDSVLWIIEAENENLNDDGMGGVLATDPLVLEIGDQFGDSMSR